MGNVLIISGTKGGGCRCGHLHREGEVYYLVEGRTGSWTLCEDCGKNNNLRGERISVEEIEKRWFGEKSAVETLVGGR